MPRVTRRNRHLNEECDDYELPKKNQSVVKVVRSNGYNLHLITTPRGEEYLVSMPTKFRKVKKIKRGDYILVEPIAEGDRVKGEIVKVMNKKSIKHYKENNVWPEEFDDNEEQVEEIEDQHNNILFVYRIINRMLRRNSEDDSCYGSDSNNEDDELDF